MRLFIKLLPEYHNFGTYKVFIGRLLSDMKPASGTKIVS